MRRLSSLFPLLVVGVLAGASLWLEYVVRNEGAGKVQVKRHEPDAVVRNFEVLRYSPAGELQYQLNAEKLLHFPDDDSSELTEPRILFAHPERPSRWSSKTGVVTDKTRKVVLIGDVKGQQPASATQPAQTLTTQELTLLTEDEIARTDKPLTIVRGNDHLHAEKGGEWDNINGLLKLSRVQATLP